MTDIKNLKILIIEDEEDVADMLKDMLSNIGVRHIYDIRQSAEAVAFLKNDPDAVDVILCDWNMPDLDGLQLLQQFRAAGRKTPFIMLTGRGDMMPVATAKSAGVSAYLLKPYSMIQLESKIIAVIREATQTVRPVMGWARRSAA